MIKIQTIENYRKRTNHLPRREDQKKMHTIDIPDLWLYREQTDQRKRQTKDRKRQTDGTDEETEYQGTIPEKEILQNETEKEKKRQNNIVYNVLVPKQLSSLFFILHKRSE